MHTRLKTYKISEHSYILIHAEPANMLSSINLNRIQLNKPTN